MPVPGLSAAVARARRAVAAPDPRGDGALLAAFVAARDGGAFAALVERFGPMVYAVCRRHTRHHHDAEDAFQAVFVVLARKAAAVVPREAVGGWLYGVAVRTAREARSMAARRAAREVPSSETLPAACGLAPGAPDPDLAEVIDAELAALPEKYRTLLVRCDLRDEPQTAVAAALGVPVGTVYSRLAAARKQLAARLTARGVAPGVGGVAVALGGIAARAVPPELAARAAAVALAAESGSAAVAALAHGVFRTMFVSKLKPVTLAGLVVAALATAAASAPPVAPPAPPPRAVAPAVAPAPRAVAPAPPGRLFFFWGDGLYTCDPDGANGRVVQHPASPKPHPDWFSASPAGTRVAFTLDHEARRARGFKLLVVSAAGTGPATDLGDGLTADHWWAGDGTAICVGLAPRNGNARERSEPRYAIIDVATGRRTPLAITPGHDITDWSRDGDRFLTGRTVAASGDTPETHHLWVTDRTGTPTREVAPPAGMEAGGGSFSPDGRRVLYAARRRVAPAGREVMLVCELATGTSTPVADIPPGGRVYHVCWAPDGRRLAYTWHADRVEPKPGEYDPNQKIEQRVIVCDTDGRNRTTVVTGRSTANDWSFGTIDWR